MNTDYQWRPVCPHCGHVHQNAWEWPFDIGEELEHECGRCGEPFVCERQVEVTYSTRKVAVKA